MPDSPQQPQQDLLERDFHVSDSTATAFKGSKNQIGALDQTRAHNVQTVHARKGVEIRTKEDDAPRRLWGQTLVSAIVPVLPVVYVSVMATLFFSTGAGAEELFETQIGNGGCPSQPWWWPFC